MIKGFENETAPLSDYEQSLLPLFIQGFTTKLGKKNAITNKQICSRMKAIGHDVNDTRIRKIINHIRNNNLVSVLLASSKGYWVSKDIFTTQQELFGDEICVCDGDEYMNCCLECGNEKT